MLKKLVLKHKGEGLLFVKHAIIMYYGETETTPLLYPQ